MLYHKRGRHGGLIGALAVLIALLSACGDSPTPVATPGAPGTPPAGGHVLHVTVTTTQIRSMADAVAGNAAKVTPILQASDDPHAYEPKPSDVQLIANADLVLRHGMGLDHWLDKVVQNAGGNHPIVTVTTGVKLESGAGEESGADPHVWFDVTNAMTMTRDIRDAMIAADPANKAAYQTNADAYLATLQQLDSDIMSQIATIPPDQRKMVTNHDAFGYYIRRYGLTFVGSVVPSMDSSAEPSAKQLAELIDKIKAEHVRAIFLERSINPKLEKQIAAEAGVNVVDTLYGDTLGPPNSPAYTYEGMMRYNTQTIVRALK
jgi:ABC-type Zn uptake system ZnuABC Zn-binding protein ZnuA